MLTAVRAFLEHLIDYAGMFPPARLPMREALRHYTQLAATPESWMLGRFVCPAAQLGELLALVNSDGAPPDLAVTALGRGGRDFIEFLNNLDADLEAIGIFREEMGRQSAVDVIELPPPPPSYVDDAYAANCILEPLPLYNLRGFVEAPSTSEWWQHDVGSLADALHVEQFSAPAEVPLLGLKLRCGGAAPAAIPTVDQITFFIARCREVSVPWKATAGLHHPLCHRESASGTMAHGFLNVFAAGIFARVHALSDLQLMAILREESAAAFRFREDRLGWREWECTVDQIRDTRRVIPSFGSCSFVEPRDALRALGLLP